MPKGPKGCLTVSLGMITALMLTLFGFGLTSFLANGERTLDCGSRGCRSFLVGVIVSGVIGVVSGLGFLSAMMNRD
jgi:hypothetical protein